MYMCIYIYNHSKMKYGPNHMEVFMKPSSATGIFFEMPQLSTEMSFSHCLVCEKRGAPPFARPFWVPENVIGLE